MLPNYLVKCKSFSAASASNNSSYHLSKTKTVLNCGNCAKIVLFVTSYLFCN